MGFFSSLFQRQDPFERELMQHQVQMCIDFMGMDRKTAVETTHAMLARAKKEMADEGVREIANWGDQLVERSKTDETVKQTIADLQAEGVQLDDIRWWWNLREVERRMMLYVDEWHRMVLYMDRLSKGFDSSTTADEVRRFHPMFGDPRHTTHTSGDSSPLPVELKKRITNYIIRQVQSDPVAYKHKIENSPTFNALVRAEIRRGNL